MEPRYGGLAGKKRGGMEEKVEQRPQMSNRERGAGNLSCHPCALPRAIFSIWTNKQRILVYPQKFNIKHSPHPK